MFLKEMAQIIGCDIEFDQEIKGFETDSRKIKSGFVFFALKGESFDGHHFLKEVASQGALCAIVSQDFKGESGGLFLIPVSDVLSTLQKLATKRLSEKKMKCVAVTGSVGKTTTKEFIATLLEGAFVVEKTPGNANSQVGLPLSILNSEKEGEVFVAEMGMTNHGDITSLLKIAPPDFVVVTKIALAHAAFFPKGLEEVAYAKAEILKHPRTQKAFINVQARQFQAFQEKQRCPLSFYGLASDEAALKEDSLLWKKGEKFAIQTSLDSLGEEFSLPFTAKHFCENFLAGALVARELGMEWDFIFKQAMKLTPYKMRFEQIEKKEVVYINDAYNANPESVKAALENLPLPKFGGKVIAVLGEMRELGIFSEKAHREVGQVAAKRADLLLCLGNECLPMTEEFSKLGGSFQLFLTLNELKETLNQVVKKGDVVLIKASNSLKLWQVLDDFG